MDVGFIGHSGEANGKDMENDMETLGKGLQGCNPKLGVYTCMHTYMHTSICVCICVCICICIGICICIWSARNEGLDKTMGKGSQSSTRRPSFAWAHSPSRQNILVEFKFHRLGFRV